MEEQVVEKVIDNVQNKGFSGIQLALAVVGVVSLANAIYEIGKFAFSKDELITTTADEMRIGVQRAFKDN